MKLYPIEANTLSSMFWMLIILFLLIKKFVQHRFMLPVVNEFNDIC